MLTNGDWENSGLYYKLSTIIPKFNGYNRLVTTDQVQRLKQRLKKDLFNLSKAIPKQ